MIPAWFRCDQQTEDGVKMIEVYKFQKEILARLIFPTRGRFHVLRSSSPICEQQTEDRRRMVEENPRPLGGRGVHDRLIFRANSCD